MLDTSVLVMPHTLTPPHARCCVAPPQVRLAAVAAVVSLSSQDSLFADAAGLLLSDLVGDQLLEVRLAALRALLTQAEAFQQRKQPQQQQGPRQQQQQEQQQGQQEQEQQGQQEQQQEQQEQQADAAAADSNAPAADIEMEEPEEGEQQDADDSTAGATGQHSDATVLGQSTAEPQQQQQQQQQQRPRRSKPRKSDLPPWGKDAMLSAAAALSDKDGEVRHLALQLLQQLPPANVPDLLTVVKAVAAAIQRYPCQETVMQAWAFVGWLGSARAEMVTLAPGKLAPQLASLLLPQPAAAAAVAVGSGGCAAPAGTVSTAAAVEAAAAGAAGVLGVADAGGLRGLPLGAQVLAALLLLGVQQRRQGLPSLLRELGKAGLTDLPVLQPWLATLQALQQQQQPVPEQSQEGGAAVTSC
jgi:hypothetical protein